MTDAARRTYLALGRGFVVVGVAIAVLAIADLVANLGFFRGGPLGTAVFLTLVGGALLWTVRQADAQRAEAGEEAADAALEHPADTARSGPTSSGPEAESPTGRDT